MGARARGSQRRGGWRSRPLAALPVPLPLPIVGQVSARAA